MTSGLGFYFLIILGLTYTSKTTADCASCTDYGNCIETTVNGTCAQCACPQGFTGDCCENDAPAVCSSNPCNSNSSWHFTCTDFPHGLYQCTCQPGYTGTHCDTTINGCNPNPCVNANNCNSGFNGNFTCNCKSNYNGKYCQTYTKCSNWGANCGCNPSNANPCKNGGTCLEKGNNQYTCMCPYGYTGTTCQNQPCASSPCQHGGQCIVTDSSGTTQCICPNIWNGDHCTDFDICGAVTCENGGTCMDHGDGTATCNCVPGASGPFCEDIPDNCDPNPCWYPLNGENITVNCTSHLGGYTCDCPVGTTDQNCSTNIDECTVSGSNVCTSVDTNATCTDGLNSYTCTCDPAYTGTNCETVRDFCDPNPCWYPLNGENISATCNSIIGSYACDCPVGTTGDDCHTNFDDCVVNGTAVCTNLDTNATCTDGLDSFSCHCNPEYTGPTCEEIRDFCDPNPCYYPINGTNVAVTCDPFFGGYSCECPVGTTDQNCSTNIDDCNVSGQNVCKKNDSQAVCTDGLDSYTCTCSRNYTGPTCEEMTNFCLPNPCRYPLNGKNIPVKCTPILGDYICNCPVGTTGKNCSINLNDCIVGGKNPCNQTDSSATCVDGLNSYQCNCGPQYTGDDCSMSMIVWNVIKLFGGSDALIALMEQVVTQPSLIKSIMPFLLGQMPPENQSAMSWEYDDLFVWASYERTELTSMDIIKWFDTTLGNCFTFNHQNSSLMYKLRQAGTEGGFRALMRVRQDEYLAWYDTAALLLFVHPSDTTVFSESLRYQIAPNTSGTIITTKITYSRLGGKYGACVKDISQINNYYYSGNYTTDGCLSACYQDAVQESCGCMDPRYAMSNNATACSIDAWNCVNNVTIVKGDPSNWESCFCPSPCDESQYESEWTTGAFVSSDTYCDSVSSSLYSGCMSDYTDMAYVNVYVPRLSQQVFREAPAMTFNQFIGYTGGMIGMFIGVSIISFIDFVVLFFAVAKAACFKGEKLYGIE